MDDATLVPMAIGIAVIVLIGGLGLVMFKSSGVGGGGSAGRAAHWKPQAGCRQEARPGQRYPRTAQLRLTWRGLLSGRDLYPMPKT